MTDNSKSLEKGMFGIYAITGVASFVASYVLLRQGFQGILKPEKNLEYLLLNASLGLISLASSAANFTAAYLDYKSSIKDKNR